MRKLGLISLILLVCLLANMPYFLKGESIYHITSVGSSPLYFINLQIDNFKHLLFYPQYWINTVYTGGPIHAGIGIYNPLLLLCTGFTRFSDAMIFYEILLKFLGGVGIFLLLKRYLFSDLASLCCSLIFPLNPFNAAFGADPQFSSILYFLPWIILLLEFIFEHTNTLRKMFYYSIILSIALAICYLANNVQNYTFVILFVIIPFIVIRVFILSQESEFTLKNILKPVFFIFIAFIVNLLLIVFEIIPTLNMIRLGDRGVILFTNLKTVFYSICLIGTSIILLQVLKYAKKRRYYLIPTIIFMTLIFSLGAKTLYNLAIANYFIKMNEINYFTESQDRIHYFFTLLQLLLITVVIYLRRIIVEKRLILFYLSLAYFCLNIVIIFLTQYKELPYYPRYAFIPILGVMVGLAWCVDYLRGVTGKWPFKYFIYFLLLALPIDNYWVYLNRAILTTDVKQIEHSAPEYVFLKRLKATERFIDTYEKEHSRWKKGFNPKIMPKWMIPAYFGAHTFSRVGVVVVPHDNSEYNRLAMPLYFGVDKKQPLTPLLSLAGVKYIFSLEKLDEQNGLKFIKKGDEYFIYENTEALPRVILFSDIRYVKGADILATLKSKDTSELLNIIYLADADNRISLNNSGKRDIYFMNDDAFVCNLGRVRIKKYESEYIQIACDIKEECLLMLTDTYFHGWNAYVDGERREVIKVDLIFRGLKLLPGDHSLVMKYESLANRYALYISCLTLIVVILALGVSIFINFKTKR